MASNYSIEVEDGILTVRFLARPTLDELRDAIDSVAARGASDLRLWDLSWSGLKSAHGPASATG